MIDLDVRLDSSLIDDDYGYLSRLQNLERHELRPLSLGKSDRKDYLKAREEVLELLQTEEAIKYAMASIIHRLYRQGYLYVEVGVTPNLHTKSGLTIVKVINAALRGLYEAIDACDGMEANMIVYCLKSDENKTNLEVIRTAAKYKEEKVVAIGLEGIDVNRPLMSYKTLFTNAKKAGLPVVLELSPSNTNAMIIKAIEFGASRIIAPYKLDLSNELVSYFSSKQVHFEFRPSYDLGNGYMEKMEDLPLKSLWFKGLSAFISAHSYGIYDTDIRKEAERINEKYLFPREDMQRSLFTAINSMFGKPHEKARAIRDFAKNYTGFLSK